MVKRFLLALFIAIFFLQLCSGLNLHPKLGKYSKQIKHAKANVQNPEHFQSGESKTKYSVGYFVQDLDHFNYGHGSDATLKWNMRYLYNDTYWGGKSSLSPIFVYCGNEGDITGFWNNSGFMVDTLASEQKAYLLFPEHRYFGTSMPYGSQSLHKENLIYLTADQAMADFAIFIKYYKAKLGCPNCPVIAFGGSYGGMLASWMRMKYPNIIDGAWASSAPILYFNDVTPQEKFFQVASWDFGNSTAAPKCGKVIKEGFKRMDAYIKQSSGSQYQQINDIFDTCTKLKSNANITAVEDWIMNAYLYMAMVDYPYPTNFLTPMPGYPVDFSCQAFIGLDESSSDKDIFTAMRKSALIFYNYQNATGCNEIFDQDSSIESLGIEAWNVLACTQVILPMGSNGKDDIFSARLWSYDENTKMCKQQYGVQSRYDWALNEFGGWNIKQDFRSYSNIFFSNGLLDPWHAGGVLANVSDTVVSYIVENSAHHLDLRLPQPGDPQSVITVRQIESQHIKKWVKEKQDSVKSNRFETIDL